MRLWILLRKKGKIFQQTESQFEHKDTGWDTEQLRCALEEPCRELDLSVPVVLEKHTAEMEKFGRTVFRPADFIESVSFDTLEAEIIGRKKEKDPRSEMEFF